jgi:predicted hydrocarbon binding protein
MQIGMTTDEQQTSEGRYYWPNKMGRMYLLALEDVMGKNGVNAVLNLAQLGHLIHNYPPDNLDLGWSFDVMGALNQALDELYGPRGAKGLSMRAGRAGFYYAIKDFGSVLGVSDLAFRLLPLAMRMRMGLNAMAETFNKTSDQIVRIQEEADCFLYHVDRCAACWGRTADVPICHAGLGLLMEGLHWVTGGKNIRVEETLCIAKGDETCTYTIDRRPLA